MLSKMNFFYNYLFPLNNKFKKKKIFVQINNNKKKVVQVTNKERKAVEQFSETYLVIKSKGSVTFMESLHGYRVLPPSKPFQNHPKTLKPISLLPNSIPISKPTPAFLSQSPLKPDKIPHLLLGLSSFTPLPCFASETVVSANDKINLESIVVSIDEFFNRNPFFVAGVTFIWLVVLPLTEVYFKKFKFISAIDAFKKLRDDPNAQLLDIRDGKSLAYLGSPNLKILNKEVVQVQFSQNDEDGFLKSVSTKFADPKNTIACVLDK